MGIMEPKSPIEGNAKEHCYAYVKSSEKEDNKQQMSNIVIKFTNNKKLGKRNKRLFAVSPCSRNP
jgi:hypothetical protein